MAEINHSESKSGKGKKRSKKISTKVDMTPMVDLAFLLITFFMLTTTFHKQKAMEVNMPDKTETKETSPLKESKAMTIILGEKNKIYWFMGIKNPKVETSDFTIEGIRSVIKEKNKKVNDLVIIIKAAKTSKYKNMVDILDEMHINGCKRYAIVSITADDLELIKNS